MALGPEQRSLSLPDELERLRLNGRASDAQFAQNPLPVAQAMGRSLARLHASARPGGLASRTTVEVEAARQALDHGNPLPTPFTRVRRSVLLDMLETPPEMSAPVLTHGTPIVSMAVLTDSIATFEPCGTEGWDPPERDLSIVMRSIAETFTSEVARTFLDGYEETGGALPHGPTLDWYALVAAFR